MSFAFSGTDFFPFTKSLEEDKKLLEREFARMPKVHELERRIQELELGKSELIKEITHRKEEINDLKEALAKRQVEIDGKAKEYKESLQNVDSTKVDLFNVNSLINQITRECDKILNEIELVNYFYWYIGYSFKMFTF